MDKKHKFAEFFSKFYLRHGRGHQLLDFVIQLIRNIVYLGGLGFLIHNWFPKLSISPAILTGIAITYEIVCYALGYLDELAGFWKFQNDYSNRKLTPFFAKMGDQIEEIYKKITWIGK